MGVMRLSHVPLLVLIVALAGCAAQPTDHVATAASTGAVQPSGSVAGDPDARLRQYAACLREHGLDVPDPQPGAGVRLDPKVPPATTEAAVKACAQYAVAAERPP